MKDRKPITSSQKPPQMRIIKESHIPKDTKPKPPEMALSGGGWREPNYFDFEYKYRIKKDNFGRFYIQERYWFFFWHNLYKNDSTEQYVFETEKEAVECVKNIKSDLKEELKQQKEQKNNYVKYL